MTTIIRILRVLAWISGIALIAVGLWAFFAKGAVVPLLIVVALVVVGPVEDILKKRLRLPGVDPDTTRALVDQATSLGFILLLLAAVWQSLT